MITFADKTIPGRHGCLALSPIKPMSRRYHVFGVRGVVEIRGGYEGQEGVIDVMLYDDWTDYDKIEDFLAELVYIANTHGELKIEGIEHARTVEKITFLGFEPVPLGGRTDAVPMLDYAGSVDPAVIDDDDSQPRWYIHGNLRFFLPTPIKKAP